MMHPFSNILNNISSFMKQIMIKLYYWHFFLFEFVISNIGCYSIFVAIHFVILGGGKIFTLSLNLVKSNLSIK